MIERGILERCALGIGGRMGLIIHVLSVCVKLRLLEMLNNKSTKTGETKVPRNRI